MILGTLLGVLVAACAGVDPKEESERKSSEAYYQLGSRALNEGNYQKAMLEFRKAESFQPKDPQIQNAMGLVYFYMQKYDESEKKYKKAVALKKDYSESYVNLGSLYARQERYQEAIDQFRKALNNPFYPTPALAHHNIGLCYQGLGDFDKAQAAMHEAIQTDPNLFRASFDLGKLYYQNNQVDQSIQVLSDAVQRHPKIEGDPINALSLAHLHYWLGLSYFKNGDSENSVVHFQEVTRLTSNSQLSEEAWKYLDLLQ
jgi:type IV pilus assembly protein PilF